MALLDPHSYWDDAQARVRHVDLQLAIDFAARRVQGHATLELSRPAGGALDLDTRDLEIEGVEDEHQNECRFELGERDPIRGQRLRVFTESGRITVRYRSGPGASALQWLAPEQTAGLERPFVYTQCQAIHARSILPCQDSPGVRITYRAELEVDAGLSAVMAAAQAAKSMRAGRHQVTYEMRQPIPPYLFAFAAGDLAREDLGRRSAVYAEPSVLAAAASEFQDVEAMIRESERLFGPYEWERFDVLLMPPSFPYGGMENPRLTFVTPTLLAGDRSLVNVLAHELAHSWTGNLVTNATLEHFWLNEGFTVYAERRILEALEGKERAELHAALGFAGLQDDLTRFGPDSPLTQLHTSLEGQDPDVVFSLVPYEKGYLLLRRVEDAVGREAFDHFLKRYIATFRFQSIITEDFLALLRELFPWIDGQVDLPRWLEAPGLPADAPAPRSKRLQLLRALAGEVAAGTAELEALRGLSALDWQVLLESLPKRLPVPVLRRLDETFGLSAQKNAEIRGAFLVRAAGSRDLTAHPAIEDMLGHVGRLKYLRPLYAALLSAGPEGQALARRSFDAARSRYHPLAARVLEGLFA